MSELWIGPAIIACFFFGQMVSQEETKERKESAGIVLTLVILAMGLHAMWPR